MKREDEREDENKAEKEKKEVMKMKSSELLSIV